MPAHRPRYQVLLAGELHVVAALGIEFEQLHRDAFDVFRKRAGGDDDAGGVDAVAVVQAHLYRVDAVAHFARALADQLPAVALKTLGVTLAQR